MTDSPKPAGESVPADTAGGQKSQVGKDTKPQGAQEVGGMIGEGSADQPAAEVTENDPRTTRPGGMVGEG